VDVIVRAAGAEPVVLVPHSNSGLYMPAVIDALGDQVRAVVFVDAALPGAWVLRATRLLEHPGRRGRTSTALDILVGGIRRRRAVPGRRGAGSR